MIHRCESKIKQIFAGRGEWMVIQFLSDEITTLDVRDIPTLVFIFTIRMSTSRIEFLSVLDFRSVPTFQILNSKPIFGHLWSNLPLPTLMDGLALH